MGLNSTASIYPEESGSSTEIAMLKFIDRAGVDTTDLKQKYTLVQKMPFSSSRKRMSSVI